MTWKLNSKKRKIQINLSDENMNAFFGIATIVVVGKKRNIKSLTRALSNMRILQVKYWTCTHEPSVEIRRVSFNFKGMKL